MNRAEAKPDLGAFWKGKTRRTADAMLKKERGTFVSGGGGWERVVWMGEGLQEASADKVDVFPGAAFEGGEVLFIWPCEEEDEERSTTDRAAGVLSAGC